VLYEKYGHRVIYDAHSKLEARLYSVIKDGLGNLRPTHFDQIVNIQSKMSFVPFGDKDIPHWSASKNGMYYCSHTWDSICGLWCGQGWNNVLLGGRNVTPKF
jgi:hypothetical protein